MLRLQSARALNKIATPAARCNVRAMTAFSNMSDNDPKILEEEKLKILKAKDRKWNEKLASASEAAVKADHLEDVPLDRLQKESIEEIKKETIEIKRKIE
ncbi:hypothetical protein BGW37DRAFT_282944 [Umbelopsis sp. PMI_123]|nr:hypothetical protein BGW37DRAFT_282944 [Umbelopsis sp. PMI_123]